MFRDLLTQLGQTIDNKIDEIFERSRNRSMFLLDQLFQRVYPIDLIVHQFNNLKNTNKVEKQIQELLGNIEKMKEDQRMKNEQIQRLSKVEDGEKMEDQMRRLYNELKKQVDLGMKQTIEFSRLIEGDISQWGYQPLMKLEGNDMGYNSDRWTKVVPALEKEFNRY